VSHYSLKTHLRRSNYTIDQAIISMSKAGFDASKIKYLTRTCKQLGYLKFQGVGLLGDSLATPLPNAQSLRTLIVSPGCEISLGSVVSALEACRLTLVEADISGIRGGRIFDPVWPTLESMKTLCLRLVRGLRIVIDLNAICKATPNITSVALNGWTTLTQHRFDFTKWRRLLHLDLNNTQIAFIPLLAPTLKYLDIGRMWTLDGLLSDENEPNALPLLETFICSETHLDHRIITSMTNHSINAGNLKTFHMGNSRAIPPHTITSSGTSSYPASETVGDLSIAGLLWSEEQMIQLVNQYPNLRKLDVATTRITGVAVRHFVAMGIKWLCLNECEKVSLDAVEYARGKGVEVEYRFPSRANSSRRFRDSTYAAAF